MAYLDLLKEVKQTLANEYSVNLKSTELRLVADTLFNVIAAQAQAGSVRVPAFGTFKTKIRPARPARTGRNPSTGEPLEIAATPAKPYLAFKQAKVA